MENTVTCRNIQFKIKPFQQIFNNFFVFLFFFIVAFASNKNSKIDIAIMILVDLKNREYWFKWMISCRFWEFEDKVNFIIFYFGFELDLFFVDWKCLFFDFGLDALFQLFGFIGKNLYDYEFTITLGLMNVLLREMLL